jgi:hypothetical protein
VKWFFRIFMVTLVAFLAIQAIPYGRDHDNPTTVREPAWDSTRTRTLARQACFDCHSNITEYPWYSNVAPVSWLLQRDVEDGRKVLDFSEWNRAQDTDLAAVVESLEEDEMPPWYYRLLHEDSRLSALERQQLQSGLVRTWTASPPGDS